MKMRMIATTAFTTLALGSSAVMAAEIPSFCPKVVGSIGFDGNGILKVWGIPVANGKPLMAVPNNTWPRFVSVAAWRDAFLDAKRNSACVKIYYDPVLFTDTNSGQVGYRIWEVVE